MGYFANGTEGTIYHEHFCQKCVHWHDAHGCPCWTAHESWNYAECNKRDSVLHRMIPREGVGNAQCIFYVPNERRKGI